MLSSQKTEQPKKDFAKITIIKSDSIDRKSAAILAYQIQEAIQDIYTKFSRNQIWLKSLKIIPESPLPESIHFGTGLDPMAPASTQMADTTPASPPTTQTDHPEAPSTEPPDPFRTPKMTVVRDGDLPLFNSTEKQAAPVIGFESAFLPSPNLTFRSFDTEKPDLGVELILACNEGFFVGSCFASGMYNIERKDVDSTYYLQIDNKEFYTDGFFWAYRKYCNQLKAYKS